MEKNVIKPGKIDKGFRYSGALPSELLRGIRGHEVSSFMTPFIYNTAIIYKWCAAHPEVF
jgi:hypothetical protein